MPTHSALSLINSFATNLQRRNLGLNPGIFWSLIPAGGRNKKKLYPARVEFRAAACKLVTQLIIIIIIIIIITYKETVSPIMTHAL